MDFPYATFNATPDTAFPDRKTMRRPVIGVLLQKNGKSFTTMALLDLGSDFCVFPSTVAEALDIPVPNERATISSGTAAAPQVAFFENVRLTYWNANHDEASATLDVYVGFCDTLEHVGLGLLGQDGFFSRLHIEFDLPNNLVRIT